MWRRKFKEASQRKIEIARGRKREGKRRERARLQDIRKDNEIQNDLEDAPRRKKSSEQTGHKAEGGRTTKEGDVARGRGKGKSEEEQREEGDGTGRDGRRKEAPENSLRRLADFAPRRFPCPVNRKAGYSFRGGGRGGERMGLSTFPLLYTLHRAYIPRQVDQSCAVFVALSFSHFYCRKIFLCFILPSSLFSSPSPIRYFFYFKMSNVLVIVIVIFNRNTKGVKDVR